MGYAILRSIHLLSIVVWVGGMFFAHWCLRPAAAALEPPHRATLMRDALRRFLDVVLVAALLVLASGVWMIAAATRASTRAGLGFAHRNDVVIGLVEGRPDEIVHRGIDDHECLVGASLDVQHRRQEQAGIRDDQPAVLEDELEAQRFRMAQDRFRIGRRFGRTGVAVRIVDDAESASDVEMLEGVAVGEQVARQ